MRTCKKEKCSICGRVIRGRRFKVGNLPALCPKCNSFITDFTDDKFDEEENPKLNIFRQIVFDIIKSVIIGLLLTVLAVLVYEHWDKTAFIIIMTLISIILM